MEKIERIYHHHDKWEDYKAGFYDNISGKDKELMIQKVVELFSNPKLTEEYMQKATKEWFFSCEHNLTNESMNKIAYIGQAACCLYGGVPNIITMYSWKFLDNKYRIKSDKIASKILKIWTQEKKYQNILKVGNLKVTKMGYQMKLLLN